MTTVEENYYLDRAPLGDSSYFRDVYNEMVNGLDPETRAVISALDAMMVDDERRQAVGKNFGMSFDPLRASGTLETDISVHAQKPAPYEDQVISATAIEGNTDLLKSATAKVAQLSKSSEAVRAFFSQTVEGDQ